jgi:hypothetical protein
MNLVTYLRIFYTSSPHDVRNGGGEIAGIEPRFMTSATARTRPTKSAICVHAPHLRSICQIHDFDLN